MLVDCFVSFVAAHFADCVFEHDILLEEVVDGNFTLSVVVHRALEEEAEEALDAMTAGACREVAQENEVEAKGSCEDRVAAEEVDLQEGRCGTQEGVYGTRGRMRYKRGPCGRFFLSFRAFWSVFFAHFWAFFPHGSCNPHKTYV